MDLVRTNQQGNNITTSLIVAQVFGKEHKNVIRDIESLSCSSDFNRLNFEPIEYNDSRGRIQRAYEITKDGFSFLVMGYTGQKAGEFKENFITEFNKREALLKSDDYILMRSQQILTKRVEAQEAKIKQLTVINEQQQALRVLHYAQKWRRGAKIACVNPYVFGIAIDRAIKVLRNKNL